MSFYSKSNDEPFVEVEIMENQGAVKELPLSPAAFLSPASDEKRNLFYAMRQIARDHMDFTSGNAKAFYYQARFMKDFEDDYPDREPFSSYYPYYQQLNYQQLRTYFTWRTQVRKGSITDTSVSYGFLYIYELLNNIGVSDPAKGFRKLMDFWQEFRKYQGAIDRYVLQWLKDYHIYYSLPHTFREFVCEHNFFEYYPTTFGYESDQQNSFAIFSGISKYNIKKSIFYNTQTEEMINNCFYYILDRLRTVFRAHKKCFEDLIFYPLVKESVWMPFSRSLFYPHRQQPDRQIVITKREIYQCRQNRFTCQTVILSDHGRRLISYIMKEMESSLRQAFKFKHRLLANPDMCSPAIRKELEQMGIPFPQFIKELVKEFYAVSTRRVISVDAENLNQIRQEARQTQEKLIVPEEKAFQEEKAIPENKPRPKAAKVSTVWDEFNQLLTEAEREGLRLLLAGKNLKTFAAKKMMMLEVLVDEINQKAMDSLGDAVLELDDDVILYEEYRTNLREMVNSNGK